LVRTSTAFVGRVPRSDARARVHANRAYVHACPRMCVRACVRACVCALTALPGAELTHTWATRRLGPPDRALDGETGVGQGAQGEARQCRIRRRCRRAAGFDGGGDGGVHVDGGHVDDWCSRGARRLHVRSVLRGLWRRQARCSPLLWQSGVDGAVLQALHRDHRGTGLRRHGRALPHLLSAHLDPRRRDHRRPHRVELPHVHAGEAHRRLPLRAVRDVRARPELYDALRVRAVPPHPAHPASHVPLPGGGRNELWNHQLGTNTQKRSI